MPVETLKSLGKVVPNEKGGYKLAFFLAASPKDNEPPREMLCQLDLDNENDPIAKQIIEDGAGTVTYHRGAPNKSGFHVLGISIAEEPLILH